MCGSGGQCWGISGESEFAGKSLELRVVMSSLEHSERSGTRTQID